MKNYYIYEKSVYQIDIMKSKFISILSPISSQDDVERILKEIKKEYPKARHYIYAYILDQKQKSNDDGEPSGTAGKPTLELLNNQNLTNCLLVTVRYFGGIKLGAGGLVRAYTRSVADACNGAQTARMTYASTYRFCLPYEFLPVYDKVASTLVGEETARTFDSTVQIERTVPQSDETALCEKITALFMGKVSTEKIGENYYAFSVK